MKKIAALNLTALIAIGILVYAVDYFVWRYRLATGHLPYGTVTAQFYYAIQEKNGKTEYDYQPPAAGYMREFLVAARRLYALLV